ncbi:BlaI/MecI/CopY family transcriptional regulator [Cupriavidus sp. USMAA2-4]|uniref:BlaI/MecI/CopY family transcriptional regulator n=1 Tax=Cupriavidus malaysiensis TaxID=367825 RepID=A0ABM6FA24_9BURK|nr:MULTISPECIES: BlaI/MecI/CopY family transcriptional regulator [Cupriavidus]AOY95372.1 BlaI/MecI/CopY family transcriptional regulator [Cupriavidus sp. USMAA2-4]AOZ01708.1 BlaI/MecI/CopY family transcriptional regulator [Cupriavidus sp. USMAHM13]AOZ08543.1 BlaI/MecI/CopY family transcriptional regulator [Cupriavidus malaysiensis]
MNRFPASPLKPTSAELDVLQTLWETGPATVKAVHQAMAADRPELTYANVLRLMQIMHGKGLLERDESERSHVYAPAQSQKSTQASLLKDLISKAFAGSGKALVLAALRGGHVSQQERAEIEDLLRGDGK